MPAQHASTEAAERKRRDRCYGCFRPRDRCFCDAIPAIDNRTNVLILQHIRERFHAFNTARIVRKSLRNASLLVGYPKDLSANRLPLDPRAGLLYPGPSATLISDVPAGQRPDQLVVIDGTWNQAKTLLRDVPALNTLPRYKLAPDSPGRYRIRREPDAMSLSTLEATVAALRILEPETSGLDQLLEAFESMVDRQLAHPKSQTGWRRNARRRQLGLNIPRVLTSDLDHVVVAYGESTPGQRGGKRGQRPPIYWVAERLGTNDRFAAAIESEISLTDSLLGHFELSKEDFTDALTCEEFRAAWAAFSQSTDILAVYHQSTRRLLSQVCGDISRCVVLKSVSLHANRSGGTLEERLAQEGLVSRPATLPGRAGKRLAKAITLVQHLNAVGNAALGDKSPEES